MASSPDELLGQLQSHATVRDEPVGRNYEPPKGRPILALPPDAKMYVPAAPNQHTDKLAPYERRHIIPIAMMIAPVFDTVPVPDDVYRAAPEYAKHNLFCIISRSDIRRDGGVLSWDPVVVVVKKLCVVRVQCTLEPQNDKFAIRRMLLWSRRHEQYQAIQDPESDRIDPSVLPYILDRYAQVEGIIV